MRKMFQDQWHGINFQEFAQVSPTHLADAGFYEAFYRHFLTKYNSWSGLDPNWVNSKLKIAEFLKNRLTGRRDASILSVSCGVGIMEKALIDDGYTNLDVTECSRLPLTWLKEYIPQNNIFIGAFPECIPPNNTYDLIYLSESEYFLNREELICLLKKAKSHLSKTGKCILISGSLESIALLTRAIVSVREFVRSLTEALHIKSRRQFWGYTRNRNDFYNAMESAGFTHIEYGLINREKKHIIYWIEGSV